MTIDERRKKAEEALILLESGQKSINEIRVMFALKPIPEPRFDEKLVSEEFYEKFSRERAT